MNTKSYFILRSSDNGMYIEKIEKDKLLASIIPDDEGYTDYGKDIVFLTDIPEQDKGYWLVDGNPMLIIYGEIIVPQKKEVVTRYEL